MPDALASTLHAAVPDVPAALVDVELSRIERSTTFRRSPRHLRLLRYLVTRSLAGDGDRLKESVLAVEVFGRKPGAFDPQRDTTVRVEARRLRQKLDRYYEREGSGSRLAIRIDAGRYAPRFELRATSPDFAGDTPSIIVLPLLNLSGDAKLDAWCDAVTEELIDALVQVPGLKVVARTTSFSFKQQHEDVRAIARAVGVRSVLEGSVQKRANGRRVVAQLVDGDNGIHLWSHAFEAETGDALHLIVHRLASAVARSLALQRGQRVLTHVTRRVSDDADAADAWHRGRYLLGRHTPQAYRDATALFARAIERDPKFALAWAAKAKALTGLYGLAAVPDPTIVDAARGAVARALELDAELGDAHATASTLAFAHDRNLARAERAALDAIRYSSGRAYVHHNYAWMLMLSGRFAESVQEYATARELDPLDPMLRVHRGLVDYYRREFARAAHLFAEVIEMEPTNLVARVLLGCAQLGGSQHDSALVSFERVTGDVPGDSIGWLGVLQAHALAGRLDVARETFEAMIERFGADRVGPYRMAIACARLTAIDDAFAWLDRAADAHDLNLVCLAVDPSFDDLRDDARWLPALARYGLPQIDSRVDAQIALG